MTATKTLELLSTMVEVNAYSLDQASWYCDQLERGKVLFFKKIPFDFADDEQAFLLSQKQTGSRFHKNISYRPGKDILKGVSSGSPDRARLHQVMQHFSQEVTRFLSRFLVPYAGKMQLDFASFRPLEEQGRDLPLHKRNDLLHVDAFPTRPTRGGRILRVFANINPTVARVWQVGEPFHEFLPRLMQSQSIDPPYRSPFNRTMSRVAAKLGLPVPDRSRYDEFMLHLHDWLKENGDFQKNARKTELTFPPGCAWMVFTDGVPHAVMSGQFALEQTFIVPPGALVSSEAAPVRVLEAIKGMPMAS